jgi:hypothetical protein
MATAGESRFWSVLRTSESKTPNHAMNANFRFRRLVSFLLALCGVITAAVGVTVFLARAEFPAWFWPIFLGGSALLLAIIGAYAWAAAQPLCRSTERLLSEVALVVSDCLCPLHVILARVLSVPRRRGHSLVEALS